MAERYIYSTASTNTCVYIVVYIYIYITNYVYNTARINVRTYKYTPFSHNYHARTTLHTTVSLPLSFVAVSSLSFSFWCYCWYGIIVLYCGPATNAPLKYKTHTMLTASTILPSPPAIYTTVLRFTNIFFYVFAGVIILDPIAFYAFFFIYYIRYLYENVCIC